MAPIRGLYRIIAAGAGYDVTGGLGAVVSTTFHFDEGEVLKILVGQRGDQRGGNMVVGGAGGSFVFANDSTPLVVAGGAGSCAPGVTPDPASNAILSQIGRDSSEIGINFGMGGIRGRAGLRGSIGTGGGAGLLENGDKPLVGGGSTGATDTVAAAIAPFGNITVDVDGKVLPAGCGGRYMTGMS